MRVEGLRRVLLGTSADRHALMEMTTARACGHDNEVLLRRTWQAKLTGRYTDGGLRRALDQGHPAEVILGRVMNRPRQIEYAPRSSSRKPWTEASKIGTVVVFVWTIIRSAPERLRPPVARR